MTLPKALLYIDGQATNNAITHLGFHIDFKRLLAYFEQRFRIPRRVYATMVNPGDTEFSSLRPLLDWLQFNRFQTLTRERMTYYNAEGSQRFRGTIDTALAVDALQHCTIHRPDALILMSGDGDLAPLIPAVQHLGVTVWLVSTTFGTDKFCDSVLRRLTDEWLDLNDIQPMIASQKRREPEPVRVREPAEFEPVDIGMADPRELVDTTPKPVTVERRKVIRRGAAHS